MVNKSLTVGGGSNSGSKSPEILSLFQLHTTAVFNSFSDYSLRSKGAQTPPNIIQVKSLSGDPILQGSTERTSSNSSYQVSSRTG